MYNICRCHSHQRFERKVKIKGEESVTNRKLATKESYKNKKVIALKIILSL